VLVVFSTRRQQCRGKGVTQKSHNTGENKPNKAWNGVAKY